MLSEYDRSPQRFDIVMSSLTPAQIIELQTKLKRTEKDNLDLIQKVAEQRLRLSNLNRVLILRGVLQTIGWYLDMCIVLVYRLLRSLIIKLAKKR